MRPNPIERGGSARGVETEEVEVDLVRDARPGNSFCESMINVMIKRRCPRNLKFRLGVRVSFDIKLKEFDRT